MNIDQNEKFLKVIKDMVYTILVNENLLRGDWQNGKVKGVISKKMLTVSVNGSSETQNIPCNPDVPFAINDEVFVVNINGDSRNKFVLCRRGV